MEHNVVHCRSHLPSLSPKCRFQAVELFPALAMDLAGLGESRVHGPGQRGFRIRTPGPFPKLRYASPERNRAQGIRTPTP